MGIVMEQYYGELSVIGMKGCEDFLYPVSYTHLTLPTILLV